MERRKFTREFKFEAVRLVIKERATKQRLMCSTTLNASIIRNVGTRRSDDNVQNLSHFQD